MHFQFRPSMHTNSMTTKKYADFCTELHQRSLDEHEQSDRLINLKLAVALSDLHIFVNVLTDFYFVFKTIEEQLRKFSKHPHVNGVLPQELLRTAACEEDLQYYLGDSWREKVKPSVAGEAYCSRIVEAAQLDPTLLIAYTHSLYLALMFGGTIIKKTIKQTLNYPDDKGLAVFTYSSCEYNFRDTFKENINKLELTREMKENIMQEKRLCYALNDSLFINIEPSWQSYGRLFLKATAFVVVASVLVYAIKKHTSSAK